MKYSIKDFHITSTDMDLELFTDESYKDKVNRCINEVMSEYESNNHTDYSRSKHKMNLECYQSIILITDKSNKAAANKLIGIL